MGLAVVTVASGGLPVVDVTNIAPRMGLPVEEALRGIAVTKVLGGGLPVMFLGGAAAAAPGTILVTSFTSGGDRSDFDGEVGIRLGIGAANLTFTWMGVRCNAGNSGTRRINLYEWFARTLIRTVTIDLTGKTAGQTVWVSVPTTTLLANGYYALVMEVQAGGQPWANTGPTTLRSEVVNVYDCYAAGTGGALNASIPNNQFVGLNLGWDTGSDKEIILPSTPLISAPSAGSAPRINLVIGDFVFLPKRGPMMTPTGEALLRTLKRMGRASQRYLHAIVAMFM